MRIFTLSILVTIAALITSFIWGGWAALAICALLTLMEISFSFDNAVVNATVLRNMNEVWRRRFLTWGILIAVFGVRLVFPLVIVAFATGLPMWGVTSLALNNPDEYSAHVLASHVQIGAFGGMFLMMVFLHFLFNEKRELHWIAIVERKLARMGKLESVEVVTALCILLAMQGLVEEEDRLHALVAGIIGVVLYVSVNSVSALLSAGSSEEGIKTAAHSGLMGFIYLQFLDASFSLDGVIGAFAMSKDIVIIMLGLGAGAIFVRSITIYLVEKGTLNQYVFLEHGAHYGIGALALIMLASMVTHVPEYITGTVGVTFIMLSLWSSVKYKRKLLLGEGK